MRPLRDVQSSLRLTNDLWTKADQLVPKVSALSGESASRADVIREALARGLEALPRMPEVFADSSQSPVRMPAAFHAKADSLLKRFAKTQGLKRLRRADILREAIILGLESIEKDEAP